MKKNGIKKLGALVLSGILAVSLAGCGAAGGAKSGDKEISIGVTPVPHQEIVKAAVVPALEKEGYKVKVVEFNDYVQPFRKASLMPITTRLQDIWKMKIRKENLTL